MSFDVPDSDCLNFRFERNRLNSFMNWREGGSKDDLSLFGFYLTEDNDIKCWFCEASYGENDRTDVRNVHLNLNPECPLMNGHTTNNIAINAYRLDSRLPNLFDRFVTAPRQNQRDNNFYLSDDQRNLHQRELSISSETRKKSVLFPMYPNYILASDRLKTFAYFPKGLEIKAEALSDAGFFHLNQRGDAVLCYVSGCGLKDWTIGDDPFEQHALHYGSCDFVQQIKGQAFVDEVKKKQLDRDLTKLTSNSTENKPDATESSSSNNIETETLDTETSERGIECKICLERDRDVVLYPCMHFVVCMRCSIAVNKICPVCRKEISKIIKVYMS